MKKGRPKGTTGKARALSKKEMDLSISMIQLPKVGGKYWHRDSVILATSYYLGLRAKELAGLNASDIMSQDGLIKSEINITVTKGDKARNLYIPDTLKLMLFNYINHSSYNEYYRIDKKTPLFQSQKGGRFTPNTMQSLLKRIYIKCNQNGCSSHTGRRSFATRLIEEGADIKAVSTLMGHSSINMTARYVQDNPERLQSMVNRFL